MTKYISLLSIFLLSNLLRADDKIQGSTIVNSTVQQAGRDIYIISPGFSRSENEMQDKQKSNTASDILKVPLTTKASEVEKFVYPAIWNTSENNLALTYEQTIFDESLNVYEKFENNKAVSAEMYKKVSYGWVDSNFRHRPDVSGSEFEVMSYCGGASYQKFLSNLISRYGSPFLNNPVVEDISEQLSDASGKCVYKFMTCTKKGNKKTTQHKFDFNNGMALIWQVIETKSNQDSYSHFYGDNSYYNLKNSDCIWKLTVSNTNMPLSR